jgi:hypothetical protein
MHITADSEKADDTAVSGSDGVMRDWCEIPGGKGQSAEWRRHPPYLQLYDKCDGK